jgi:flavorubredoxin
MSFKMTDKVTWVGKIDWELRRFHGDEYSTHRGSSYNSYLIKDKKNVLNHERTGAYNRYRACKGQQGADKYS